MPSSKKPRGYWTKEKVFEEGGKYSNRRSWQLSQSRSYSIAWENGWLDQIIGREIVHGKWTKETVFESAKKYLTKTAWRQSSDASAYVIAKRNGWLKEINHFEKEYSFGERTIYKWLLARDISFETEKTFDGLRSKYPLRFDFWIPSRNLLIEYQGKQHNLGWGGSRQDSIEIQHRDEMKQVYVDKHGYELLLIDHASESQIDKVLEGVIGNFDSRPLTKDELNKIKNLGGWTKERALLDAKKYKTRNAWDKASYGYSYARINGFLDEACQHMERVNAWTSARKKLWTKDAVLADAKKYQRPGEWKKSNPSAYAISLRNGWHPESTAHMLSKKHGSKSD